MFARVSITVADAVASVRFYETVLGTLGFRRDDRGDDAIASWGEFHLREPGAGDPPTRGLHIGFAAKSREQVDAFWKAGVDAGYRDDGAPGLRPQYTPDYYGSFLLDPDGNSAEAGHYGRMRTAGQVDHLWIRVPDVGAAHEKRLAEAHPGHEVVLLGPDHLIVRGPQNGSVSYVTGPPTENVHLEFGIGLGSSSEEP